MATAVKHSARHKSVTVDYDRAVDVLYLTLGPPSPVEGAGLPRGVELDFSPLDGSPSGVTVIGYARNSWHDAVGDLADIASSHLGVAPEPVLSAILSAAR